MTLLFVYLFVALFISFLCSIVEATLLSTPISYLKSRINNEDMALQTFLENKEFLHFSRIPVYHVNKDNITGYVFRAMVFEKLAEGHFDLRLKDIKREILTFHKNTTLFNAWDAMLSKREHISIVVDEYGGIDGIVSLEDIIESLLGFEIIDEKDKVEDMQQFALERWKERQTKYQLLNPNDQ